MSQLKRYSREDHEMDLFRRVQYYKVHHSDYTQQQVADALRKEYPGERGLSRTNIRRFLDSTEFYKRKREKGEGLTQIDKDNFHTKEKKSGISQGSESKRKSYFNLASVNPLISKVGIATVYDDDKSILKSIWKLYLQEFDLGKSWFECDLTFSKGDFYKTGIPCPKECFDKYPIQPDGLPDPPDEVFPLDKANQKLRDDSVSSIVIDLPQKIADKGKGSKDAFSGVQELVQTYNELIGLAYQKLKSPTVWEPGGVLVIKVGDIDYKGKRIWLPNLVTGLATGVESGLYDPISEEFEKYVPYDFTLIDKFIHLYKDIDLQQNPKGPSIKAHDYFLVFSKGEKKEESAIYFLSDEKSDERLAGTLSMMNNYHYVSDDLAKLKKEVPAGSDFGVYKVRFKNKTLQNTISTQEKINEDLRKSLLKHKYIPKEMFENGHLLLLYLEDKINTGEEDFEEIINSLNKELSDFEKLYQETENKIKNYKESNQTRKIKKEEKNLNRLSKKIKKTERDKKSVEKDKENANKIREKRERLKNKLPVYKTILKAETIQILKDAGVDYVEIIYNRKGNKKIIILNEENIEIELFQENVQNNSSKEYLHKIESGQETEIFFHGTGVLFDSFDLGHALEGDGKVKFGYGVYVTSSYSSAAHYSGSNDSWTNHYVYEIRVPQKKEDNYIAFKQPVDPVILKRAQEKLGEKIPEKYVSDGGEFRKFLAKKFKSQILIDPIPGTNIKDILKIMAEKAASEFLSSIGVDFIDWPYNWINPNLGTNRAILDDKKLEIIRISEVKLDNKKKLIPNSEKIIR